MKKLTSLLLAAALLALCLAGCGKKETLAEPELPPADGAIADPLAKPEYPLADDTITGALAQAELDWTIDAQGTSTNEKGLVTQTLRAPDGALRGGTLSGVVDGKRYLSMTLPANVAGASFTWADWEQSLRLAALLYGGFEDAGALYDAFSEEPADLSGGRMTWDKELSGVQCRVTACAYADSKLFPGGGVMLVVYLYEDDLDALWEKYGNTAPAALPTDKAAVTFEDEHSATAVQQVTVGEKHAVSITVSFSYELQGDRRVITDIGSAEAENLSEWQYVERAATVAQDKIVFSEEGSVATVPVTYQASIGDGSESYDATVAIDLTAE